MTAASPTPTTSPERWTFPDGPARPGVAAWNVWLPAGDGPRPAVVLAGDLLARAGRGVVGALAGALARRGVVALETAAAHAPGTRGFEKTTLAERQEDLSRGVTALFERMVAPGRVAIRHVAVAGHGLGGTAAIAAGARDSRVSVVLALGAPGSPRSAFPREAIAAWERGGDALLEDPVDGSRCALGPALLRDWRARRLDPAELAAQVRGKVVWAHAEDDAVVDVAEARRAYFAHPDAGSERARLLLLPGGHDLGVSPDAGPGATSPGVEAVAEALVAALGA